MREWVISFFTLSGMAAFIWLVYLGMKNDSSKRPTIHPPDSKLEREMRKSAAHNKWT